MLVVIFITSNLKRQFNKTVQYNCCVFANPKNYITKSCISLTFVWCRIFRFPRFKSRLLSVMCIWKLLRQDSVWQHEMARRNVSQKRLTTKT